MAYNSDQSQALDSTFNKLFVGEGLKDGAFPTFYSDLAAGASIPSTQALQQINWQNTGNVTQATMYWDTASSRLVLSDNAAKNSANLWVNSTGGLRVGGTLGVGDLSTLPGVLGFKWDAGNGRLGLFNDNNVAFLGMTPGNGASACSGQFTVGANLIVNTYVSVGGTDTSGTPGNATVNKASGIAAIAAAATTCVITSSLATTTCRVDITWLGDLGTQSKIPWVTRAAGSFTVNVGTAPAGATAFSWEIKYVA